MHEFTLFGRFFAEEDPTYRRLILNIKTAKRQIELLKKDEAVIDDVLVAVFDVNEQLITLLAGVRLIVDARSR